MDIKRFFKRTKKFVPDARLEQFVVRIDELITNIIIIQQSEWSQSGYSDESKGRMEKTFDEIKVVVQEGGEELRQYLTPFKGLKDCSFEDTKRVRAANQLD